MLIMVCQEEKSFQYLNRVRNGPLWGIFPFRFIDALKIDDNDTKAKFYT